jgi:peptidoglycan/LPS O-acetylase OafA/YrhL
VNEHDTAFRGEQVSRLPTHDGVVEIFFVISGFVIPYSLYQARWELTLFSRSSATVIR